MLLKERNQAAYRASPNHDVYWIWTETPERFDWSTVVLTELDLSSILSGYEDGTENPKGDAAIAAAIVRGQGAGWQISSQLQDYNFHL